MHPLTKEDRQILAVFLSLSHTLSPYQPEYTHGSIIELTSILKSIIPPATDIFIHGCTYDQSCAHVRSLSNVIPVCLHPMSTKCVFA